MLHASLNSRLRVLTSEKNLVLHMDGTVDRKNKRLISLMVPPHHHHHHTHTLFLHTHVLLRLLCYC